MDCSWAPDLLNVVHFHQLYAASAQHGPPTSWMSQTSIRTLLRIRHALGPILYRGFSALLLPSGTLQSLRISRTLLLMTASALLVPYGLVLLLEFYALPLPWGTPWSRRIAPTLLLPFHASARLSSFGPMQLLGFSALLVPWWTLLSLRI